MLRSLLQRMLGVTSRAALFDDGTNAQEQRSSLASMTGTGPSASTGETPGFLRKAANRQAIADLKAMMDAEAQPPIPPASPDLTNSRNATAILSAADIGSLIRERRKRAGLSQKEVCRQAHVGTRFLVELEAGKNTLEIGKVLQVAGVLGLDVSAG